MGSNNSRARNSRRATRRRGSLDKLTSKREYISSSDGSASLDDVVLPGQEETNIPPLDPADIPLDYRRTPVAPTVSSPSSISELKEVANGELDQAGPSNLGNQMMKNAARSSANFQDEGRNTDAGSSRHSHRTVASRSARHSHLSQAVVGPGSNAGRSKQYGAQNGDHGVEPEELGEEAEDESVDAESLGPHPSTADIGKRRRIINPFSWFSRSIARASKPSKGKERALSLVSSAPHDTQTGGLPPDHPDHAVPEAANDMRSQRGSARSKGTRAPPNGIEQELLNDAVEAAVDIIGDVAGNHTPPPEGDSAPPSSEQRKRKPLVKLFRSLFGLVLPTTSPPDGASHDPPRHENAAVRPRQRLQRGRSERRPRRQKRLSTIPPSEPSDDFEVPYEEPVHEVAHAAPPRTASIAPDAASYYQGAPTEPTALDVAEEVHFTYPNRHSQISQGQLSAGNRSLRSAPRSEAVFQDAPAQSLRSTQPQPQTYQRSVDPNTYSQASQAPRTTQSLRSTQPQPQTDQRSVDPNRYSQTSQAQRTMSNRSRPNSPPRNEATPQASPARSLRNTQPHSRLASANAQVALATNPVSHSVGPGQHFIQLVRNHVYKRHGFKDYAKVIKRHQITLGDHNPIFFDPKRKMICCRDAGQTHKPNVRLYQPSGMTGEGGVAAEDVQNDSEYVCPVTVGTPGVTLTLDFDTGSSDLWVWSTETRATRSEQKKHTTYNPRRSRTSKQLKGLTWEISYADGSHASGDVHEDVVSIGGVKIPNQAVEVAQDMSSQFLESGNDGLLGLAFPRLNTVSQKQKTPMENMIEQKLVKEPVFTVKLDKGDSDGYYTFGYIDQPEKSSKLFWTRILPTNGYWEFRSCYMKFGTQIYKRVNNTAILDTGTTLILLHDTFIHLIYSAIPGARLDSTAGGYIFPTNTKIPPLSFCVGDHLFTIPGSDLAFSDAEHGMSFGAVQSRGGNPQDILGDVFLKHIYAVFDQSNPPRLGIAQRS